MVDLNDGMDMDEYGDEIYDYDDEGMDNSGGSGDTEEMI
jgi:hypothetical protein